MDWHRLLVLLVIWLGVCPLTLAGGQGSLALALPQTQAPTACAGPVPGKPLSDCANRLTARESIDLEKPAAAVVHAGASRIVFVRVQSTTGEQTPPTSDQQAAATLARLGLGGACGLLVSGLLLLLATQVRHRRRVVRPTPPTLEPPGNLPPALAGALVRGHIRPVLQQATILALACRHVLVLEPIGERWVAIHLLSDHHLHGRIERVVWDALFVEATPEHFVSDVTLQHYNADWAVAGEVVRQELVRGGYFDPQARRWQGGFGALGTVGLIAAFFELLATGIGGKTGAGWGSRCLSRAPWWPSWALTMSQKPRWQGNRQQHRGAIIWRVWRQQPTTRTWRWI